MSKDEKAPRGYRPTRRVFLRDATFVSLGVIAAACAPGGGSTTTTTTTKGKKGGEFRGNWPIDLPPKGVWNYYGNTPILGGSYLIELVYQNLAIYRWADKKWDYLMAESHTATPTDFTVKLRKGTKWDSGTEVTSKDAFATFKITRLVGSSSEHGSTRAWIARRGRPASSARMIGSAVMRDDIVRGPVA